MESKSLEFPPIYLLPAHLEGDELPELESQIPTLTYDVNEAKIILGKVSRKARAVLELRSRKVFTDEVSQPSPSSSSPPNKRRKVEGSNTEPGTNDSSAGDDDHDDDTLIRVVRLAWYTESMAKGRVLPVDDFLVYRGRKKPVMPPPRLPKPSPTEVLHHPRTAIHAKRPALLQETTSEHELAMQLPPVPAHLQTPYACQRPTPYNPPNAAFVEQLKVMRKIRTLEGDEVGVRAYSTSIASIAAYPYLITHVDEITRLPGCGAKIVELYVQWANHGYLDDIKAAESDTKMRTLRLFYDIWGVAATTARDFYNRGWRDLDDIVEYGWDKISRVQQVGVKFYDEFQLRIPREETEAIAQVISKYANQHRQGYELVVAGSYRRGSPTSGDVDVILSHRDAAATAFFVGELVCRLERDGYITHALTISHKNSERGQAPVASQGQDRPAGSGFDTLDKALVVWQDPADAKTPGKNPNPHRRVDIIVTPWRTAGCAVIGWTGGTTFERDLRRYCKKAKALKFDSSGVRERADGGRWVDLESGGPDGQQPAPDMLTAEKRVLDGLGLKWYPPEERCTG
ncbi:hypothetical protein F4780DRAFT_758066 [Xylariomycetidae sp. FL0641]|nr:hypothetical protein F4780DRAFT_758066 [Xylariomycetidae sp. FL0641]